MSHYRIFPLAAVIIVILASTSMAQDTSSLPYMNPKLSPEERAADLVHRMTLEEKASQLVNQARTVPHLNIASYDWWSEALARSHFRWRDRIPGTHWSGRDLRCPTHL